MASTTLDYGSAPPSRPGVMHRVASWTAGTCGLLGLACYAPGWGPAANELRNALGVAGYFTLWAFFALGAIVNVVGGWRGIGGLSAQLRSVVDALFLAATSIALAATAVWFFWG